MSNQTKILIIAPSWIGDLVMAGSLFRFLKQQNSNCTIDVFSNKSLHSLIERMPEVDNCLSSPFVHGKLDLITRFKIAKVLRKKSYDHAYILANSFKSALIPLWANIPIRTGWLGEFRYLLLNDIKLFPKKFQRMVDRFLMLGINTNENLPNPIPLPQLSISKNNLIETLNNLNLTLPKEPILAICPGAEYGETKRWPAAYFAKIAKIKKSEGWNIWIFGSSNDSALAKEIQEKSENSCLDLTGKTNLGEAADLLSLAKIVLTNDSGLMHIAAALNRPVVALYGSTCPNFTPPLIETSKILYLKLPCSPCFKRKCLLKHTKCLYNLYPELVIKAINELI